MQGEVANFKISQNRFVWFELKDNKSYFSCFLMVFNLRVQLEDGMSVQLIGCPGLFTKSGRFHFAVKEIKLVGEGTLKKEFELLKKKLEQEGLFATERKRIIPRFPQKIGLITSQDAAAYTDVMRILKNRWAGLSIYFYPVSVQGQSAVNDIVGAFHYFNAHDYKFDAVILTRGGGSMEDLWAFNTEEICRAVFGSRYPVVSAIGHERDVTLVDYVADVRAATPSNAAEMVVPHKDDVIFQINTLVESQSRNMEAYFEEKNLILDNFSNSLDNLVASLQEKIEHNISLLKSYNPRQVLSRGYSITKHQGKIIKDGKKLKKNDIIETQFFNGKRLSKVN
ncbi:MAG: exodeoxyribonuclease VII large subunit [Patescibacteria group bacterium]